ncbi:hypothetical protein BDY21DRAFT_336667 [Lineolata rhizophorae]|uniref:Uncharacterized protein n=1 Tax=Lineolata rhizophorae TaxID=578093 RepID=A0A6A6P7K7_9PEZI|nr:hypothetical protein BDY21DRAFT_336667 [Lineolata rhizophorae]
MCSDAVTLPLWWMLCDEIQVVMELGFCLLTRAFLFEVIFLTASTTADYTAPSICRA